MKTIEDCVKRSEKFGKTIAKAYTDAGAEPDFSDSLCYGFPCGPVIDDIVKAISLDFADDNYKAEYAEDFINWWIWEVSFGKYVRYKFVDGDLIKTPAAEVTLSNGKTYVVTTPGKLYDVIMKDKKLPRKK